MYHIFNQGNNRQRIFFNRDNYLYFLKKIRKHVLPFSDILAWCLMPNHFHLMILVNHKSIRSDNNYTSSKLKVHTRQTLPYQESEQTFQKSIGILLSSYTRAINKQNKTSGSLFRKETKALCLSNIDKITRTWYTEKSITRINHIPSEKEYPSICFNYILFNPVKDNLVSAPERWEFSSYPDITGNRNGTLISKERIKKLGLAVNDNFLSD